MPRHCQVWLAGWLAGWHLAGPPSILRDAEHAPHPRSRRLGLSARGQPGTCAYLPTYLPAFDALPVSTHKRLWFRLSCIAGTRTNTARSLLVLPCFPIMP